ncbi:hypothetical protein, partial [Actinomyces sp. 186855]
EEAPSVPAATPVPPRSRPLRSAVALLACACLSALGVLAVGAPASAVYSNPSTSASGYSGMIDWLDWDGASNTRDCTYTVGQAPHEGRCIPADGSTTSTMWSSPRRQHHRPGQPARGKRPLGVQLGSQLGHHR